MSYTRFTFSLLTILFMLNGCGGSSDTQTNTSEPTETLHNHSLGTTPNSQTEVTTNILPTVSEKNLTTIELLVLVDANDKNNFNGLNDTKIDHFISVTNTIYANSGIPAKLEIKKIQPYHFKKEKSEEVLYEIYGDNNITNLRNENKADLVIVYRKYANDGSCGVAFVNNTLNKNAAYANVSLECASTSTAHEIGHIMGLTHSEHNAPHEGSYEYARGYGVDNEFITIMAYTSSYNTNNRVYNYSNPEAECLGYECGVDEELDNGANAVKALKYAVSHVANFR